MEDDDLCFLLLLLLLFLMYLFFLPCLIVPIGGCFAIFYLFGFDCLV